MRNAGVVLATSAELLESLLSRHPQVFNCVCATRRTQVSFLRRDCNVAENWTDRRHDASVRFFMARVPFPSPASVAGLWRVGRGTCPCARHGVVGTRSLPDVVECDDKKVIAAISKKTGLTGLIATLLEKVCGAIRLADVIKLKPEVSKTAAKAAWSTGTRAQKTLQALGVEVKANRSCWVIEPAAIETAAPAA